MTGKRRVLDGVKVHPTAELTADWLEVGAGSVIGAGVVVEGTKVVIGREAFLDRGAYVGGGSAWDPCAFLVAGDFLHMGRDSHVNTARGVTLGHEVGLGVGTKVFTHGAYLSELDGFPVRFEGVTMGDRVWMPNAWVNPGVAVGSDVVVAARSLVNRDLPGGCFAAGIPAEVLREGCYPRSLSAEELWQALKRIISEALEIIEAKGIKGIITVKASTVISVDTLGIEVRAGDAVFNVSRRTVRGEASELSEVVRHQLRRHGIRFRYSPVGGVYRAWEG